MSDLARHRRAKDEFFRASEHSPLTVEQRRVFRGLAYYPENPDLRFETPLEPSRGTKTVELRTSTGELQHHEHQGSVCFTVNGSVCTLQVYGGDGQYFIPFVDATAPEETYGAGRYVEAHARHDGRVHLDFNLAYNPYCAYNDRWSCPLPPSENRLTARIEAGEKVFHA